MNQATSTTTADTHPVDLEVLRLQLEEDGRFYHDNRNKNSKEARERLLHTLQTNNCREIIATVVDGDDLANAFVVAGSRGRVDILEAFINHGMNADIKDKDGCTALTYASYKGRKYEECVGFLLDHNAKVNGQNLRGMTALMYASQRGFIPIIQMLLEKNANPDIQDVNGTTALMRACMERHSEVVQLLLNHGADIDLKDYKGKTALDLAKTEEIKDIIRNHVSASYVLK